MSNPLGFLSEDGAAGAAALAQIRGVDAARDDVAATTKEGDTLATDDRDQLARDIAAIERAAAALRRAEPALQSWNGPPAAVLHKPRPLWLLIGALWLSTALATMGAIYAISAVVG
jgi:hypothetical protein